MNPFRTTGSKGRRRNVGAVSLAVIGVNTTVGIGGCRSGIKTCHPLLVVVAGGVAVGFVVNIIEVVECSVFVVNAGVKHRDNDALAVVASLVGAGRIDVGRHGPRGF